MDKKSRVELLELCKTGGLRGYSGKTKYELIELLTAAATAAALAQAAATTVPQAAVATNVKNKSPLRYPGGKTRAIKILEKYVDAYKCKTLVSPCFGGGSFELWMYDKGYTVIGNDLFKPLYTFWSLAQKDPKAVVEAVRKHMPVTKEKFHARRDGIGKMTDLEVAAAYYIINRTSFSGATFCGGFSLQASTGRLNDASLATLGSLDISRVQFSNLDCKVFLDKYKDQEDTVVYADPPYYISTYIYGRDGDLHEMFDHVGFAQKIKSCKKWVLSYNDCKYIRDLYAGCRIFTERWSYGMNSTKDSSEIIILPACIP
jgi:DNA adenine methylase